MRSTPMIPVPTAAGRLATQGMIAAASPFVDQQGVLTPIAYRFLYSTFRTSVGPAGPQGPVGPPGPVSPTSLTGDVTGSGSGTVPTTLATVNANVGTFQGITVNAKGLVTGAVSQVGQIPATATNDNAAAGRLGEYLSNLRTTNLALTSGTAANVCTLSLTAGDWDVWGEGWLIAGTTAPTYVAVAVTQTSAVVPTAPGDATGYNRFYGTLTASQTSVWPVAPVRVSLAATTNLYLVMLVGVASCNAQGALKARRVR